MLDRKGLLLVLSGPSGVGKGTVVKKILERRSDTVLSVSATTREKREGEKEDVNYHYITQDAFDNIKRKDGFLENAVYCGHSYGTLKSEVYERLENGINVILEIDVQGAMKVRSEYPECVLIFIFPPSLEELKKRLHTRNTETDDVIEERFMQAKRELGFMDKYNYFVENSDLEKAVESVSAIIDAEQLRMERRYEEVRKKFL